MPMQPNPIAETSNSFPSFRFGSICPCPLLSRMPFRHGLHTTIKLLDDLYPCHGCRPVWLLVGVVPTLIFSMKRLDHDAVAARKNIHAVIVEPIMNPLLGDEPCNLATNRY